MKNQQWTSEDLAWIAGLLEGEGAFMVPWKTSTTGEAYPSFRISCNMVDGDILARLHGLVPGSKLGGPVVPSNPNHTPFWRWNLFRRKLIKELLLAIRPWMGERRGGRIDEILGLMEEYGRGGWRHGTRQGYEVHKCKCGRCRASNARRHRLRRARKRHESSGS